MAFDSVGAPVCATKQLLDGFMTHAGAYTILSTVSAHKSTRPARCVYCREFQSRKKQSSDFRVTLKKTKVFLLAGSGLKIDELVASFTYLSAAIALIIQNPRTVDFL